MDNSLWRVSCLLNAGLVPDALVPYRASRAPPRLSAFKSMVGMHPCTERARITRIQSMSVLGRCALGGREVLLD